MKIYVLSGDWDSEAFSPLDVKHWSEGSYAVILMLAQTEHWQEGFMKLLSGKGLSQKMRTQLIFV